MKKYFTLLITLEPPFGEIWLVVIGVILLFLFQIIDLDTGIGWLAAGLFLTSLFGASYLIQKIWNRYF